MPRNLMLILLVFIVLFGVVMTFFVIRSQSLNESALGSMQSPEQDVLLPRDTEIFGNGTASSSVLSGPADTLSWSMTQEKLEEIERRWNRVDETFVGTSTSEYSMGYSNLFDVYSILILKEPSAKYRAQAEQEMLDALGVEKATLCQLHVEVTRSTELTNYKDFQEIGLSFCEGSVSDEDLEMPFFRED